VARSANLHGEGAPCVIGCRIPAAFATPGAS